MIMDYKDWIAKTKEEKPELSEFISKLEVFISDVGFNSLKFEKAIEKGLEKIETSIIESLNIDENDKT